MQKVFFTELRLLNSFIPNAENPYYNYVLGKHLISEKAVVHENSVDVMLPCHYQTKDKTAEESNICLISNNLLSNLYPFRNSLRKLMCSH